VIDLLSTEAFRPKVAKCISKFLSISDNQSLTVGFYHRGRTYVMSNHSDPLSLSYDVGSISKTMTAHLILKLVHDGLISLDGCVSDYIDLPRGSYPTVYELLTHTAGYGHLTPAEITVPALLRHGYARRNIYEGCTSDTVVKCLSRRKNRKKGDYSYSDFPFAILAVIAERVTGKRFSELIESFVQNELNMKRTVVSIPDGLRTPPAALGGRTIDFWHWESDNPYIAGGGLVSNVEDMLTYIKAEIESREPYITDAHRLSPETVSDKRNLAMCIGWHTYKKSNQLWHVGGVGTFRSSIIINKKRRMGVVVLGNSKGIASANVHYLAKMLYSEMKINKINFGGKQP
jgi:CubicO group peptidase (beta-lactamase class C family)